MDTSVDIDETADRLRATIGLLRRNLRDTDISGLPLPQLSALVRLVRSGPITSADLARSEQITPQSMGSTIQALEQRGFVTRAADPNDGRRVLLSATKAGSAALRVRDRAREDRLAQALRDEFSASELKRLPGAVRLLERVADRLGRSAPGAGAAPNHSGR